MDDTGFTSNNLESRSQRRIEIDPSRIFFWNCLVILALILAHLAVAWVHIESGRDHMMGLSKRFQLFTEASIPAFFSAVMLVATAVVAAVLSRVAGGWRARDGRAWAFIAVLLLYMAMDEASALHEIVDQLRERQVEDGILYYVWVLPFGALALACIAILLPFWMRLPPSTKWWLAVAAVLFLASAIGMELVENSLVAEAGEVKAFAQWSVIASVAVEEGGEMLAVAITIRTLLHHLALAMTHGGDGRVRVDLS
jgi:hypothetical protein